VTQEEDLIRTTLYIISPALAGREIGFPQSHEVRSRLYNPTHTHLFRPR
jgi:precorrin-4/cobalt-precorrin-4 C11-methyltransferase